LCSQREKLIKFTGSYLFRKFNIQIKIVLPYTLLFAAVITISSLITIAIVYRRMDERIESQMEQMAKTISEMGFLLSDDFLSNIKIREVVGADIIAYKYDGEVTATTLQREIVAAIMSFVRNPEVEESLSQGRRDYVIRNINYRGQPYKVIYRRLRMPDEDRDTIISLITFTGDIALAKRRSAVNILLVAVSGIALVALVGILIARSITAPVKDLVKVTEQISNGDLSAKASVKTHDEIGALAKSFNQMTEELKASRDKLVQSEKLAAVGQLAAGIAHEIRNPLTSIKMIVQLLQRRLKKDQKGQESILAVLSEINRLEIIINGLLDFARPMELDAKPTNIMKVIDSVLGIMEADMRHRRIQLIKHIDEGIPEIMLDANRMKQVFMNLILNSMEAMSESGILTIDCSYNDKAQRLRVEVSDTGAGMSRDVLDRLYEPFFSAKPGGTGLGMANVRKIIDLHGGNIFIESVEGEGTKVTIELEGKL
jgi:signal transduction histidine kinase